MQIPTFKMIKSNVRGLYEGTHPDPDSVPSLVDTWCDALADDRANHAAQIATLTAELHKEEEECERMTLQAQALSSIVEQVADCLITEREEDGSPVWAGKSPSIWVLEKLEDIKQVATLAAERDEAKWMYEGLAQHHTDAVAERDLLQTKLREVCEAVIEWEEAMKKTSYHDLYNEMQGKAVQDCLEAEKRMVALAREEQTAP